jgi:hypothetical protein
MKKPIKTSGSLQRAFLSQSQLKLPQFKYEVSGSENLPRPSLSRREPLRPAPR